MAIKSKFDKGFEDVIFKSVDGISYTTIYICIYYVCTYIDFSSNTSRDYQCDNVCTGTPLHKLSYKVYLYTRPMEIYIHGMMCHRLRI